MKKFHLSLSALILLALVVVTIALPASISANSQNIQADNAKREAVRQRFVADQQQAAPNLAPIAATPCVNGMAAGYLCDSVDLLAFMPRGDMGGGNLNDIWGWTDPLDGKEYAIIGRTSGTSFVDISNPTNPIYLGDLPTHSVDSPWRDVKVYKNHAYVVSEAPGHGMQIFDLTQLRAVTSPPATFSNTAHYDGFANAHNVVINEDSGFAYAVGADCSGGLHMIDISSPAAPVAANCYINDGYTHDAQCVMYAGPDSDFAGSEICFNFNEDTVTIVDVTDKSAPGMIGRSEYAGSEYTHQGWLTEDHKYLLVNDEQDEYFNAVNTTTFIWDVRDLRNPILINASTTSNTSIDHNLYNHNGLVFKANYRSGLRIADLADVANGNLPEIAYFDTIPGNDSPSFSGAWSVYPYYDSGVVTISSISEGLFIVKPHPQFSIATVNYNEAPQCVPSTVSIPVKAHTQSGYAGSLALAFNAPTGSGITAVGMPATVSAGSTTPVTLSIPASTATGAYTISFTASDSSDSKTTTTTLNLIQGSVVTPTLTSPANGSAEIATVPNFQWAAQGSSVSYQIDIATDSAFANIVSSGTATTNAYTPTTPLTVGTTYYWRVTATDLCGSITSTTNSYTVTAASDFVYLPIVFK